MARVRSEQRKQDTFWRRWSGVFILLAMFIGSWGGQLISQIEVEKQESAQHGQEFSMDEFWPQFWTSTLENWQSEWLQLFTQALIIAGFSSMFFRKGEEEIYKTQLMIEDLKQQLQKK